MAGKDKKDEVVEEVVEATEEVKEEGKEEQKANLLQTWRYLAYSRESMTKDQQEAFWQTYFQFEKGIYEQLLEKPEEEVKGTVKELAEKYEVELLLMVGFLDGINDSLKTPNPIETMEEDTEVSLAFEPELLYKNMVEAEANWLYELPQWDAIIDADRRKVLYKEQKLSHTIVKEKKVGRNDPCPCGSGKKYKFCCGK
ncbi:SEC-C metal-binding domain-containing protein [Eubacterium uniforme]|uniref:SEC-C motif-containing protein n=1 Tax=Eubacterium uniforme TaxID=39495 RepID=A0A1T4VCG5_9FIRM|nr:SEC-C metal-binding domain-containing protein [Eubacterium uniforme]SKA62645.1 SEC-C motif-containing protein [Eubacterium uniforme]HAH17558.1 SEC-C domain-containing protein [Eubacterium sp.]HAV90396.1 SEC-C domain-containing protein [Eubacterium sp.]